MNIKNTSPWEIIIGIEVHVQLNTQSKIFSNSPTLFGAEPNTQISPVDLGLPGALPSLNIEAVKKAILFGLSINAEINPISVFERKNYFYPDLPKGYQISQFKTPIVGAGKLEINLLNNPNNPNNLSKIINITRAHLEEDAGKSIHDLIPYKTAIDLNRAGMPLLEIVSEPDLRSAEEAVTYLKTLHELVTAIGITDGNLQEGSFRADLNISLRPLGIKTLGTRTEIKNINSFKFAEQAINYEVARQIDLLESGQKITQETRLFDADKIETRPMRSKEDAQDYRYFPDPDLPPLVLNNSWIQELKQSLPELPSQKRERFKTSYLLNPEEITQLTKSQNISTYFENLIHKNHEPKLISNWLNGEFSALLYKNNLDFSEHSEPLDINLFSEFLNKIKNKIISNTAGKQLLAKLFEEQGERQINPENYINQLIQDLGLAQNSDPEFLEKIIVKIIQENPNQISELKAGKEKILGYLLGQAMKLSQGRANPEELKALLLRKIQ